MLYLETKIKLTKDNIECPNLAEKLTSADRVALGNHIWEGYDRDEQSRAKWRKRTQAAMDLAMQVVRDKNFPWAGCSNVAFPLITIAALQFHSRAYPTIVQGNKIVHYKVNGEDPQGTETQRARRIGDFMSHQILEDDSSWEEQHDRLLINIPIVGCAFKKTYHAGGKGHNVSELVMAQDLVLDYFAKNVETASRKTHVIPTFRNSIHEGIMVGTYCDVRQETWYKQNAQVKTTTDSAKKDNRDGSTPPQSDSETPYTFLEQHLHLDLDCDGYAEPYIATIEENSKCLIRLVTGFDRIEDIKFNTRNEIISIKATEYFTKYGFIPSPDGGIYDMGFGVLMGPLNESVNSLLNQLIDAGTMSNGAGGFLGRGAKIRGGVYTFSPLEWKRVDSTGDDLKKSIFPLPVREPSNVLFQLLSLLINYTNRISGTTDTMVGENPGQNTPASNMQTMVEQGTKIYSAIYKRVWRSMKEEFRKLYILNAIYMPSFVAFGPQGEKALREDFLGDPSRISPVADPNITSESQRIQQAMMLKQNAMTTPGYNIEAIERNFLQAMRVDSVDLLYPGPQKMPPLPNPKLQIEQLKAQVKEKQIQLEMQQFVAEMQEQVRLNNAKIIQLEAQAAKLVAEAGGVETGHQIAAFQTAIGAMKTHDDMLRGRIETMLKGMKQKDESEQQAADRGRMEGMAGASSNQGASQGAGAMG